MVWSCGQYSISFVILQDLTPYYLFLLLSLIFCNTLILTYPITTTPTPINAHQYHSMNFHLLKNIIVSLKNVLNETSPQYTTLYHMRTFFLKILAKIRSITNPVANVIMPENQKSNFCTSVRKTFFIIITCQ